MGQRNVLAIQSHIKIISDFLAEEYFVTLDFDVQGLPARSVIGAAFIVVELDAELSVLVVHQFIAAPAEEIVREIVECVIMSVPSDKTCSRSYKERKTKTA